MKVLAPILAAAIGFVSLAGSALAQAFPATELPQPRQGHGSVICGRFLHLIGGVVGTEWDYSSTVLTAPVGSDLKLGAWRENSPLPIRLIDLQNSVLAVGNRVYAVGGKHVLEPVPGKARVKPHDAVFFTTMKEDGTLDPWKESPRWGGEFSMGTAGCASSGALYAVGGGHPLEEVPGPSVFYSVFQPDGAPGAWKPGPPIPKPLWFHATVCREGRVLVFGGRSSTKPEGLNHDVFVARIQPDHSLSEWKVQKDAFKTSRYMSAMAVTQKWAFMAGGTDRNWVLNDEISYAPLAGEALGAWNSKELPTGPTFMSSSAASDELGVLYLTGGRKTSDRSSIRSTVVGFMLRRPASTAGATAPPAPAKLCVPALEELAARNDPSNRLVICYSSKVAKSMQFLQGVCQGGYASKIPAGWVACAQDLEANPKLALEWKILQPPAYVLLKSDGTVIAKSESSPTMPPAEFIASAAK